jgi:NADH-quinone oxidoreductase subunit I
MVNAVREYFWNIGQGIVTTYKGMRLTFRYFLKPAVTMRYPEERPVVPESHRGKHGYDEPACLLCGACVAACPVDCLVIEGMGKGKETLITEASVDYSKCLFCNLCAEACKTECIWLSEEYDLSSTERGGCVLKLIAEKTPAEIAAFEELLAKKEAEKKAKAAAAKAKAAEGQKTEPAAAAEGKTEAKAETKNETKNEEPQS